MQQRYEIVGTNSKFKDDETEGDYFLQIFGN